MPGPACSRAAARPSIPNMKATALLIKRKDAA